MHISHYGTSDIGIRANNEDLLSFLPEYNFFCIADGMGGHKAGEIAAKEATSEIHRSVIENLHPKNLLSLQNIFSHLQKGFLEANKKVFSLGKEHVSLQGMGTTLTCIYFYQNNAVFAHIGDSRIYLLRGDQLTQITKDHSLFNDFLLKGKIKKEENMPKQYKNIITKAIGAQNTISPDIEHLPCFSKDKYIICSDGLSDFIKEEEIKKILLQSSSKKIAVKNLIKTAKMNGSTDNISTLLLEIL